MGSTPTDPIMKYYIPTLICLFWSLLNFGLFASSGHGGSLFAGIFCGVMAVVSFGGAILRVKLDKKTAALDDEIAAFVCDE